MSCTCRHQNRREGGGGGGGGRGVFLSTAEKDL